MFLDYTFQIVKQKSTLIDLQLVLKQDNMYNQLSIYLIGSFVLLIVAKLSSPNLKFNLIYGILKNKSITKITREEFPVSLLTNLTLLINFILSCEVSAYIYFKSVSIGTDFSVFLFYLPIIIIIQPILTTFFIELLTGESGLLSEIRLNSWLFLKIASILITINLTFWIFNSNLERIYSIIFILIYGIFYLFRILQGLSFAISKGISLYYIILYFCTFEVLPFAIVYSLLV
jgi:hypothetical protein